MKKAPVYGSIYRGKYTFIYNETTTFAFAHSGNSDSFLETLNTKFTLKVLLMITETFPLLQEKPPFLSHPATSLK